MSYNPVPSLNNGNATFNNNVNVSGISTLNAGVKTTINSEADGATITFDMDESNTHSVQLGGNRTLVVNNVDAGQKFTLRLQQDSTGNREAVWWDDINWIISGSGQPTLSSGVNEVDYFGFLCTSGGYYDGFHMTELGTGGGGGGGGGTTYNVASGLPYASGEFYLQEINQNTADIVTVSGLIGTGGGGTGSGLPYASGDYYLQEIRTNSASGVSISGTLQPQITQNSSDIVVVSGLIGTGGGGLPYASGDYYLNSINTVSGLIPTNTFNITGGDGSNYTIDGMGLSSASDPNLYLHKGHTYVFNKTFSGHPFAVSATDGGSVYADADGNNIEIGSSAGSVIFEVPQDAPSTLYYYCTAHPSAMKGLIYTTSDGSLSGYFESRVDSADSSITANSGYFESRVDQLDSGVSYVSGVAVYGSGHNLQTVTDNGDSTTNAITITNNNITASSGLFDSLDMTPLGDGDQPAYQEGVVFYDSENHTLTLYNDEPDIALQIGQEQYIRVRNNTAATIGNGTAVLINGVHGNAAPTISGAIATFEATSQVIGLTTHSIEPNSFGYVTTYGIVRDVNTSAFSAGDELYLSATQIGSGVNTSPVIPNFKITLGHVIRSSSSNGSILVQIGNAKLGGGDVKSQAPLNVSGVPFITSVSDTTAGGSLTDPLFIFDSGNRQLQLGSGLQLLDGVPSNTSNILYNNAGTLSFNGAAVDTNTTYSAGSGLTLVGTEFNVYGGSGNFEYVELQADNTTVPKLKFTGSGVTDTPITLEVRSSYESVNGSGSALLFQGTQGQLFSITDNLSSGVIFSVADVAGLPMLEVDASGHVHIGEYADDITSYKPILISGGVPTSTTNKLYNDAGTLYFNGSALGAGGGGGLPYTSGDYYLQEIRSNSASGVAISGYFESRVDTNAADIITVSGLTGSAVSAVANGVDNRVVTFSSTDALNGEANLTFNGSTLAVNGAFTATTKSFLIDHPTKEGMKLQYASLEGPENGVYIRGTSGSNIITLPEYWSTLVDQSTVTVTLTSIGYYQPLYIKEKGKNYIKVGGCKGSYDYVVYGERKDVEKLKVEW